jgi:phosphate/sulfate permease
MIMTNKILPVALIAALVGGSVGAFVMHSSDSSTSTAQAENTRTALTPEQSAASNEQYLEAAYKTPQEQSAYKVGFSDGFGACENGNTQALSSGRNRVVYRNTAPTRRVYYDYQRPRGRSFWQKHRDKLTLAMGTGAGAAIGGLIGGKKGAAIGALSGLGGSALYTYKIRNRHRRY